MFTLHNGDCLEYMKSMPDKSVDVVITDPPYNERTHQGAVTGQTLGVRENEIDFAPLLDPSYLVRELLRISRRWCLCFCSVEDFYLYKEEAYKQKAWVRAGIWDRINPPPQFTGDRPSQAVDGISIFHPYTRKHWNGGGKQGIWRHSVEFGKKQHPTQKPLSLIKELVYQFSDVGETIFDPFMGSGTTGKACIEMGRNFVGCELKAEYFAIAEKRIKSAVFSPELFTPSNNRLQPTAFGVGTQAEFPLLGGTQADESSATNGGG